MTVHALHIHINSQALDTIREAGLEEKVDMGYFEFIAGLKNPKVPGWPKQFNEIVGGQTIQ